MLCYDKRTFIIRYMSFIHASEKIGYSQGNESIYQINISLTKFYNHWRKWLSQTFGSSRIPLHPVLT